MVVHDVRGRGLSQSAAVAKGNLHRSFENYRKFDERLVRGRMRAACTTYGTTL